MSEVILKIENLSKQYRLGTVGTGTISHDLNRWWHKVRGKEDPYLKIGETNDRSTKGSSDYVWALKDINLEVKKGEVLGIIGKNGAGKSTLLKILSKVTGPTTGSIKSKGRIASLLEVGTGFHPELTGRENIFLNGAILGMTKKEITSKIDEIIGFAGVERYIDTPTKRYSSGMTVRLAFAVAAHLEPEILVVDEVLAVGDAEFQKKAIGKMQDISKGEGRTVLFVSHNMAAVQSLCSRVVVLDNGKLVYEGEVAESVEYYSAICRERLKKEYVIHNNVLGKVKLSNLKVLNTDNSLLKNGESLMLGDTFKIEFNVKIFEDIKDLSFALDIFNDKQELISHLINEDSGLYIPTAINNSVLKISIESKELLFIPGVYNINLWVGQSQTEALYTIKNCFTFSLEQGGYTKRTKRLPKHSKVYLHSVWESKVV
ncbi:lipopolysaccharide transport system ATP-binding protein [Lutibacter oricola]|uniref:Lipopolysaccharide transport system ATP-binding protein n=1 Tax=Lutibacter oricola TaxID=762486 RepID=A0A1H2WZ79_9FLAO|nr:ABC transporter ATP-binding protein [Lutibacter oricola]SDW85818.1 lipopolysaccharide transport system ATP-binding protein [Lutibacter oricola]